MTFDNLKSHKRKGFPKEKSNPILLNGRKTYPRNRNVALTALALAHFNCEIDDQHRTFLRRKSKLQYTEPHHLVPMAYQDQFDVSLDVEENIVSLCCTCHKEIHYGNDSKALIIRLYKERKKEIDTVGIYVTEQEVLQMYE